MRRRIELKSQWAPRPQSKTILLASCYGCVRVGDDSFEMLQSLIDGKGIHFAADAFAGLERLFQVMPGNRDGERVGDHFSRALVVFDPGRVRKGNPDSAAIHQELYIHRVGVTG